MLNRSGFCLIKRYFCNATKAIKENVVAEKVIGRMTGEGKSFYHVFKKLLIE